MSDAPKYFPIGSSDRNKTSDDKPSTQYHKNLAYTLESSMKEKIVISNEGLFNKKLETVNDAPYLKMNLIDIPKHLHVPMDSERKKRFYPDGYSIHYFDTNEEFVLRDKVEGRLLGQLFFHKQSSMDGPGYYYIFESFADRDDPKSLYDGKIFYLLTREQFDMLESSKLT